MSYFERVGSYFYLLNGLLRGSENSEKLVFVSEISENLKRETSSTPAMTNRSLLLAASFLAPLGEVTKLPISKRQT